MLIDFTQTVAYLLKSLHRFNYAFDVDVDDASVIDKLEDLL